MKGPISDVVFSPYIELMGFIYVLGFPECSCRKLTHSHRGKGKKSCSTKMPWGDMLVPWEGIHIHLWKQANIWYHCPFFLSLTICTRFGETPSTGGLWSKYDPRIYCHWAEATQSHHTWSEWTYWFCMIERFPYWLKREETKTPAICCVPGIILPDYIGIIMSHYKAPY